MSVEQKVVIDVDDPVVLELLPSYVKHRRLEIFQLQRLIEGNDYEKIRIIGHNLKGSGGLYGLPQISNYGAAMEEAALSSDNDALSITLSAMEGFLEQINL